MNFNSIKVRLELRDSLFNLVRICHFNSIKVRLERGREENRTGGGKFQFHKGTIRTAQVAYTKAQQHISIP